jgi:methyl-accepting chemotaxis protein
MKLLDNLSVTKKTLIATLVGVIAVTAIAALATTSLLQIQRTSVGTNAAITVRAQARAIGGSLSHAQAALYRAINLKSQNVEVAIVRAAKADAMDTIASAQKVFKDLKLDHAGVDVALATAAAKAVDDYAEAAAQAANFVEDDAFSATMFMTDAELKCGAAGQQMNAFLTASGKVADARQREADDTLRHGTYVIPVAAGIAVVLSILLSAFVGRLIARPIVSMTAAMRGLAEGNLDAEIPVAVGRSRPDGARAARVPRQRAGGAPFAGRRRQGERAESTPPGGDGSPHPVFRHLRRRRHGKPRTVRRGHAQDRQRHVGSRETHA